MELTIKDKTLTDAFGQALDQLEQAMPYAKKLYQNHLFHEAARLMDQEDGIEYLYSFADRFDQAGVFDGGPWNEPSKLQPNLVSGSLMVEDMTSVVEILSELRLLSIVKGKHKHEKVSAEKAQEFLSEVMAINIDLLFPEETEAARIEGKGKQKDRAEKLFQFLAGQLSLAAISNTLVKEIDQIMIQRPIMVSRVINMISKGKQLLEEDIDEQVREKIKKYIDAIYGPTPMTRTQPELCVYRSELAELSEEELSKEAEKFAESMEETGLVSSYHAILIRFLNRSKSNLLGFALGINNKGQANLDEYQDTVRELIKVSIHPSTRQAVYGLKRLLERGVLSTAPVIPGLRRLIEIDMQPEMRSLLLKVHGGKEGVTANSILVSGVISVLGQPLGVGQGMNPTCQTARGISLWSLHAQGYLLELIARAARDGDIDISFEGLPIHSKDLQEGLVADLHEELDPVSLMLVPHLDRIYGELCRRAQFRGEDVHKWVNPAFYGDWVSRGFSSVIDSATGAIVDYAGFVRLFYATHHPHYNEGHELIYPNPVGIFVTTVFGKLLGLHAVSIQRISQDENGEHRIYFYNPNNDSSQNWGQGVIPTVSGHDELHGESSLPFHEFVSRLYAFHYNPYEQGEAFAVDPAFIDQTEKLARESWGQEYTFI